MSMICLNMIVRNEAAILERCLTSVAPRIGAWVIADTGSSDGTPELIRDFFAVRGIPGELHEFPFENFGQARNEALERARRSSLRFDYLLLADADMELVAEVTDCFDALAAAAYTLRQRSGSLAYDNVRLLRRDARAKYVGVTHECLDVQGDRGHVSGAWFVDHASGSNRPGKFARDARLLEADLQRDPGNARNVYYLAQSYRDDGRADDAINTYLRRAAMGGWGEEVWSARYEAARLIERQGRPAAEVEHAYHAAFQARPQRAEPLYELARWHRSRGEWALAHLHAQAAQGMAQSPDRLFVDESIYRWRIQDEAAIAAQWVGASEMCFALCSELLDDDRVPQEERPRIESNRDFGAAAVGRRTAIYPAERLARLAANLSRHAENQAVTLAMISSGGHDAFALTVDSFVNCCTDVDRIERFVCVVAEASLAEVDRLRARYPCFEFVPGFGQTNERARDLDLLRAAVATDYTLLLDDGWHFLAAMDYVGRAVAIFGVEGTVAQVLFNRNFAETLEDRNVVGGVLKRHPATHRRYVVHEHRREGPDRDAVLERCTPGTPHAFDRLPFALAPSLLRTNAWRIDDDGGTGRLDGGLRGPERTIGEYLQARGQTVAFFDAVTCCSVGTPGVTLAELGRTSVRPAHAGWSWR